VNENSIIRKESVCKKGKTGILVADIRNIDAAGAEINKLAAKRWSNQNLENVFTT
jgi:hypothetical protein